MISYLSLHQSTEVKKHKGRVMDSQAEIDVNKSRHTKIVKKILHGGEKGFPMTNNNQYTFIT